MPNLLIFSQVCSRGVIEYSMLLLICQVAARPWRLRGWDVLYWCYFFMCNPKQVSCTLWWFLLVLQSGRICKQHFEISR